MRGRERKDIVGQKFGRLTAISFSKSIRTNSSSPGTRLFWNCTCDCGKKVVVSGTNLRTGNTSSCGCYAIDMTKKANTKESGYASLTHYFNQYKFNAKKRMLDFILTKQEFNSITCQNCFYCGAPPKPLGFVRLGYNGAATVNGIDRVNSDLGYLVNNCVASCSDCNYMKMDKTAKEFLVHCIKIVKFQTGKGIANEPD